MEGKLNNFQPDVVEKQLLNKVEHACLSTRIFSKFFGGKIKIFEQLFTRNDFYM